MLLFINVTLKWGPTKQSEAPAGGPHGWRFSPKWWGKKRERERKEKGKEREREREREVETEATAWPWLLGRKGGRRGEGKKS